jgi:hypothetical protein
MVIDAAQDEDHVAASIWASVAERFDL